MNSPGKNYYLTENKKTIKNIKDVGKRTLGLKLLFFAYNLKEYKDLFKRICNNRLVIPIDDLVEGSGLILLKGVKS
jgi:hypothetical protein